MVIRLPLSLLIVLSFFGQCYGDEFQRQVAQRTARYEAVAASAEQLGTNRQIGEAHQLWLDAVPDAERTAADYWILGNVMFGAKPQTALEFHQKAAELQPDSPLVQLQLAMSLHRNRRFEEAIPAYHAYLSSPLAASMGPSTFSALLADCLVRTGQYEAACDAWEAVPFRSFRIQIARFVYEVHGLPKVYQRHHDFLSAARENDLDAAARAILLDSHWEVDWWETTVNREFLKADIREFENQFPLDDPRMQLMVAIADYHLAERDASAVFAASLRNHRLLIGEDASLPRHGELVSRVVHILLDEDLSTAQSLLEAHEAAFQEALHQPADQIDVELVNVYAYLLVQADNMERLNQVDRLMWQTTGEPRFAASHLASRVREGADLSDPDVAAIVAQYPTHYVVSDIALSLAEDDGQPLSDLLGNAIAAEFDTLTPDPLSGVRTANRLNGLFLRLRESITE